MSPFTFVRNRFGLGGTERTTTCYEVSCNSTPQVMGIRTYGLMESADPLEKWMKNLKAKTCKKSSFMFYVYVIF